MTSVFIKGRKEEGTNTQRGRQCDSGDRVLQPQAQAKECQELLAATKG